MRSHCSVLLTEAKTPMSSPVEKEERTGEGIKNNKAFDKNSRRNDSESLFWFVQLFFYTFSVLVTVCLTVELNGGG